MFRVAGSWRRGRGRKADDLSMGDVKHNEHWLRLLLHCTVSKI